MLFTSQRSTADTPFAYVLPASATADVAFAKKSFQPFLDFAEQHPGVEFTYKIVQETTWFKLWFGGASFSMSSCGAPDATDEGLHVRVHHRAREP